MKRRTFLLSVSGSSLAGSALIGSGAFSRVESDRSVAIDVAGDPDAYLGLDECDSPNGSFAHLDDDGHLEILLNGENPAIDGSPLGEGVNSDSTSRFHRVFQVCNQGTEPACIWIGDDENWPVVDSGEHEGQRRVDFYLEDDPGHSVIGEANGLLLEVGDCACLGIEVRTYGLSDGDTLLDDLDDRITIHADVDGDCLATDCAVLDASYECTRFDKNGIWDIVDHDLSITNTGDGTVEYFWATLGEDADDNRRLDSPVVVEPGETRTSRADNTYPVQGLIWWTDECTSGTVESFAEFFDEHEYVDLDDVDDAADAVWIDGLPSVDDFEETETEAEPIGDVVDCDEPS